VDLPVDALELGLEGEEVFVLEDPVSSSRDGSPPGLPGSRRVFVSRGLIRPDFWIGEEKSGFDLPPTFAWP